MTYDDFEAQVATMVANLRAGGQFGAGHDYEIDVCECAAEIAGFDRAHARLFNRAYRDGAVRVALAMAIRLAASATRKNNPDRRILPVDGSS